MGRCSTVAVASPQSGASMKIKTSAGVLIIIVALFVFWYLLMPNRDKGTHLSGAVAAVNNAIHGPQPIPVKDSATVEAGKGRTCSYEFPKTPGRLFGHWSSKGKSAQIRGATDDTIVAFQLIGPNNNILHNLDHATGGNFDIRIDSPGRYTFVF